ncbi:MAG: 50S ribosomal protein L18, partial [Mycobacterium sp.]|nr:50S ribosomal protein L18 [Mycobacterium sp.]
MAQAQTAAPERKPVGQTASAARRVSRLRRHSRLRKKIAGTAERPRLV